MPDAGELPRPQRAVVPLVLAGGRGIAEVVADGVPGAAAVLRALDDLAEPAAGRRRPDAVGIGRRTGDVVHLPPREVRSVNLPVAPAFVGRQDERALARAHQNSYAAHRCPS